MPNGLRPRAIGAARGDIVIVGAGLAGLFTALKLAPIPVTVISPAPIGDGASSAWAQGGLAAAMAEGDTPDAHARDTLIAGAGIVDEAIARLTAREARSRVEDLLAYGVPFDKDLAGRLNLSREAAHSARRIVRVNGDKAGAAIMAALIAAVRATPSIRVLEGLEAKELVVAEGRVAGVRLWPAGSLGRSTPSELDACAIVLTTGGLGQLYAVTTNPLQARGEGLAIAARAGAVIADAEFVQFHPTAIDVGIDPAPLATEALRGEGAHLINRMGERFMLAVHPDAELAPRDIVARAVFEEIVQGRGAFLDTRAAIGARLPEAFPTVFAAVTAAGIDPLSEPIPIAPAAHYHMGGVLTDARGRSTLDGLWACGEVASTGLHGANRLASNSLLEAVVFGARVAADISELTAIRHHSPVAELLLAARRSRKHTKTDRPGTKETAAISQLRKLMTDHVGVVRNEVGLLEALDTILTMETRWAGTPALANMLVAAKLVVASALRRCESRGGHFRSDYREPDPALAHRNWIRLRDINATSGATASSAPQGSLAARFLQESRS